MSGAWRGKSTRDVWTHPMAHLWGITGLCLVNLGSNLFPHSTALKIHCTSIFSIRRWEEQSKLLLCYTSVFCDYLETFLLKIKYNLYSSALSRTFWHVLQHGWTWGHYATPLCSPLSCSCSSAPSKHHLQGLCSRNHFFCPKQTLPHSWQFSWLSSFHYLFKSHFLSEPNLGHSI